MDVWLMVLVACGEQAGGLEQCDAVPEDRQPPEGWAAACETDDDCGDDFVCEVGAVGGYGLFYDSTCTPVCDSDADCPIVVGECAEGPTCNLVRCGDEGFCVENTCV